MPKIYHCKGRILYLLLRTFPLKYKATAKTGVADVVFIACVFLLVLPLYKDQLRANQGRGFLKKIVILAMTVSGTKRRLGKRIMINLQLEEVMFVVIEKASSRVSVLQSNHL